MKVTPVTTGTVEPVRGQSLNWYHWLYVSPPERRSEYAGHVRFPISPSVRLSVYPSVRMLLFFSHQINLNQTR